MKIILFLLLFMWAGVAHAATVTCTWDANAPDDRVQGYAVFVMAHNTPYDYENPIWSGSETECTFILPDDIVTALVCRAWNYGPVKLDGTRDVQWSGNSEEIYWTPEGPVPAAPGSVQITLSIVVR